MQLLSPLTVTFPPHMRWCAASACRCIFMSFIMLLYALICSKLLVCRSNAMSICVKIKPGRNTILALISFSFSVHVKFMNDAICCKLRITGSSLWTIKGIDSEFNNSGDLISQSALCDNLFLKIW